MHAFATDPARGVFILGLLCIFIGGSLSLYAWRAPMLKQGGLFAPISREGGLVLNNLFLTAACAAVFVGTLYPLVLDAVTGEKISVGAPFFNLTFGPLMVPLLLAVPFGPILSWKRADLGAACQRLYAAFGLALLLTLVSYWAWGMDKVLAPLGVGLAVWVMAGAISEIVTRVKFFEIGFKRGFARLVGLPGSAWGTATAHFGIGLTVLGIVTASAFQEERVLTMRPGDVVELAGYQMTFEGAAPRRGPNYTEEVGHFSIRQGGNLVAELDPSKRIYTARQMPTTEAGIYTTGFSQVYLSLGEGRGDGAVDVRVYFKPLITLIWIGCVIMSLGAVFSIADRRLRVGAPKPARKRQQSVAAAE